MAAGNAIASGSVVLTANADQMATGLQKAEKKVQTWASGLHKNLGADFAQEIGRRSFAGGIIGGFAGGGISGGLSEIISNTLAGIAEPLARSLSGLNALAEQGERMSRQWNSIEKSIERSMKLSAEWRGAMVSQADIVDSLDKDMSNLEQTIKAMRGDWKNMATDANEAFEPSAAGFGRFMMGQDKAFGEQAVKNANDQSAAIGKLVDKWREMQLAKDRAIDPRQDPAKMGQLTKALQEMNNELVKVKMNEIDAKLFDLERLGATPAELQNAMDMMVRLRDEKAKIEGAKSLAPVGNVPGLGAVLSILDPFTAAMPKKASFFDVLAENMRSDKRVQLASAVESGTAEGYALAARNRFGGIEGGGDRQREIKMAVDAVRMAIEHGVDGIKDAMRGIGIL